jgi:hypothetical protein
MIWELDKEKQFSNEWRLYMARNGYDKGTHAKFKIGQMIEFWTGFTDDIRASASIKGINGDDLYVYSDCYWFPIQDDKNRKIQVLS